jgi:hypothetical protein
MRRAARSRGEGRATTSFDIDREARLAVASCEGWGVRAPGGRLVRCGALFGRFVGGEIALSPFPCWGFEDDPEEVDFRDECLRGGGTGALSLEEDARMSPARS